MLKLIHLLSDGQFHSGEELGEILALTRSGIWKIVQQLEKWGIDIESRKGKGYRIPRGLNLLNLEKIQKFIEPKSLSQLGPIEIFQTLSSTNDYLMDLVHQQNQFQQNSVQQNHSLPPTSASITSSTSSSSLSSSIFSFQNRVCLAEHQSSGKGRRGRSWISPFGQNIYLSLLWHFPKDFSELSGLSLAIAIAVMKALQKFDVSLFQNAFQNTFQNTKTNPNSINQDPNNSSGLGLKWPNDLIWNGKQKLSGILIELSGETYDVSKAVIGIGINVGTKLKNTNDVSQPWIDLRSIIHKRIDPDTDRDTNNIDKTPDRNEVVGILLNEIVQTLHLFQSQGLKPLLDFWNQHDITYLQPVTLISPTETIEGKSLGIDEKGRFLLETKDKQIKSIVSGEISLRLKA